MADSSSLSTPASACTSSTSLQKSVDYVNHELASAGFPIALNFSGFAGHPEDASHILNCICTVLQQRQKDVIFREDLHDRLRRAAADYDEITNTATYVQHVGSNAQKQLKAEQTKHMATKDELKTTRTHFQYIKTQFTHDLKKKELELHRLKERLQKVVTEKAAAQKIGLQLVNPLSKSSNISSRLKKATKEEDMYNIVVSNYEDREKELIAENCELRETLYDMYREIKDRLHEIATPNTANLMVEDDIDREHFSMPLDMIRTSVEYKLRETLEQWKEQWAQIMSTAALQQGEQELLSLKEQYDRLQRECEKYQGIVQEQNALLEMAVASSGGKGEGVSQSTFEPSMLDLQEHRAELEEKYRQLDEERQKFTEAAIKLGMERAALQKERELLEEEKRGAEVGGFLAKLPETPQWLRKKESLYANSPRTPAWIRQDLRDYQGSQGRDEYQRSGQKIATVRSQLTPVPRSTRRGSSAHDPFRIDQPSPAVKSIPTKNDEPGRAADHASPRDRMYPRELNSYQPSIIHELDTLTTTPFSKGVSNTSRATPGTHTRSQISGMSSIKSALKSTRKDPVNVSARSVRFGTGGRKAEEKENVDNSVRRREGALFGQELLGTSTPVKNE
ncbi:hypothetical protein HDU85_002017 [Gaertneriomyces sp. JEL0708]|nr:hypothetical protein HDU85_002017 [Gaertneriomyces sp. JEL0708]